MFDIKSVDNITKEAASDTNTTSNDKKGIKRLKYERFKIWASKALISATT
jgi:hypothetical protein